MPLFFRTFLSISLSALIGCADIAYYHQATVGQLSLLANRQPITELVNDEATSPELKQKLRLVQTAMEFAENRLALPSGDAYQDYVDTQQPYVVWNITAAQPFSLEGKTWCYPFVGCQTYRGYFAEQDAQDYADGLMQQGLDVYVSGVTAYSTLGWFDDPVLNTFVFASDPGLVALIFHELAHRVVYLDGDTTFNESFATSVELAGLKLWLEDKGLTEQLKQIEQRKQYQNQFTTLVLKTHAQLKELYRQPLDRQTMLARKAAIIEQLRKDYSITSQAWTFRGYDQWFATEINNAKLITVANYHDFVPAFNQLLDNLNYDFPVFYREVARLGNLPKQKRHSALADLSSK